MLLLASVVSTMSLRAEEMVTIPRARLQELENKEAQFEKLKKELGKSQAEKEALTSERQRLKAEAEQLKQAKKKAESQVATTPPPVDQHETPAINSLPPLKKGDVVDAVDLMNHYRTDPVGAKQRYEGHIIRVRGEITSFEKPMFVRPYFIYFRTTERAWKVACRVYPPDQYSAVFTVRGGDDLVGTIGSGARVSLASVGQKVVIEGRCAGLRDQTTALNDASLVTTP